MANPSNRHTSKLARQLGYASGLEYKASLQLDKLERYYEYETKDCKFDYFTPVVNGGVVDKEGQARLILDKGDQIVQWRKYTCDFMIMKKDGTPMYIETKGYFKPKDRVKHKMLKKLHPNVDLRIIFEHDGKVSKITRYSQWCDKNGIDYHCLTSANKKEGDLIPQGWLKE